MPDARRVTTWVTWLGLLALVVGSLAPFRAELDQSHIVLPLMLVVLGGSAGGGRPLGLTLAVIGFLVIDYAFQPPYDLFSVGKALDWIVLIAFLVAAFVATELLSQARQEAEAARLRTTEVSSLAQLGTETLRYANPTETLAAIASLVRKTLGADRCAVHVVDHAAAAPVADGGGAAPAEANAVADAAGADESLAIALDGTRHLTARDVADDATASAEAALVAVPLRVARRTVGVLVVSSERPIPLDAGRRRFLIALGHYAALGIERMQLAGAVEEARALQAENRAKDEVLAAVSHDLRTPLATIKVLAQRAPALGDVTAAQIEEETDRLSRMVSDLLDLSRLRMGGIRMETEINTAEDLVGAAMQRAQGILDGRRLHATLDLGAPTLAGRFDLVQSLRIVGNLIDNALRFTPPGGVVEVSTARDGAWMVVQVDDRGPGIAAGEAERIFEPFYRPRGGPADAGRAGLGLSIARQLAALQGGSVTYAPRPGGGSTFTLRLPAADLGAEPMADE